MHSCDFRRIFTRVKDCMYNTTQLNCNYISNLIIRLIHYSLCPTTQNSQSAYTRELITPFCLHGPYNTFVFLVLLHQILFMFMFLCKLLWSKIIATLGFRQRTIEINTSSRKIILPQSFHSRHIFSAFEHTVVLCVSSIVVLAHLLFLRHCEKILQRTNWEDISS